MRKKFTGELLNWDAHYVGIKATREHQQNCITLDEVISLALKHPSLVFAPITIEAQIPVFTEWVENALSESTLSRKKNYWYKRRNY
jgi:hypothetical protein